jgi:hypothetical protein
MRSALVLLALFSSPVAGQIQYPPAAATGGVSATDVDSKIATATAGLASTSALNAVQAAIPTAATSTPPAVTDSGSAGTQTTVYALANHTHASKARRSIVTTATDGSYTWNFSPAFSNPPVCTATAETAAGVTDVINAQIVGSPTTTSASFLVNRTQKSVAAVLSLTILSVPASVGAQKLHLICIEP